MKPYLPQHRLTIKSNEVSPAEGGVIFEKAYSALSIRYFFIAIVLCNLLFFSRFLNPLYWFFSILEVVTFFYYSNKLSRGWQNYSPTKFQSRLFKQALIIRLGWVFISYFLFIQLNGEPFEWNTADAKGYHGEASWLVDLIKEGKIQTYFDYIKGRYSDMGYAFYLGIQYLITGKSILIARIIKAILSAFTVVFVYQLASRNFGEKTGKLAGIFAMLMPNLIFYTGLHLKEVEMVFLVTLFMNTMDKLIRERVFKISTLTVPIVSAIALFFFRTVLGVTALFTIFSTLMLTSNKVLGMGKRVILMLWIGMASLYFIGGTIMTEIEQVIDKREDNQKTSMQWMSTRKNGNKFAKYMGGAVFAPMIFVIPFPTVIETPRQEVQKALSGGNYVKNILAFFTLLGIYTLIRKKKWKEHLLLLTFTFSYLVVIAFSAFAQSERFHQPALPFELILAAYGVSQMTRSTKKKFNLWLIFIFIVVIVWSWFKLAGRGMA